jgi:hypothetical protein
MMLIIYGQNTAEGNRSQVCPEGNSIVSCHLINLFLPLTDL